MQRDGHRKVGGKWSNGNGNGNGERCHWECVLCKAGGNGYQGAQQQHPADVQN